MINQNLIEKTRGFVAQVGQFKDGQHLLVTTDSRKTTEHNTFIALYGDKFDGFSFIEGLLKNSSLNTYIFEKKEGRIEKAKSWRQQYPHANFVLVENIYSYILSLSKLKVKDFKNSGGKLIALTGSNGKTTNKEMLADLFSMAIGAEKVLYTKGNLNNHIGVPLTIFEIEDQHEIAIVEMGTNHPGEIKDLCEAALPDFGMITNIGYAHIEFFKSLDGVLQEKSELYRAIAKSKDPNKLFVLNGFDEKLKTLKREDWVNLIDDDNVQIQENSFTMTVEQSAFEIRNPSLLGRHQQINMAMCISLVIGIFPEKKEKIIAAANGFELKGMNRGEVQEFGSIRVYLDAYNANPSSMLASLSSFDAILAQQKICKDRALLILGDMNEIGDQAQVLHKQTAEKVAQLGFSHVVFVGRYSEFYREGVKDALLYRDTAQLKEDILKLATNMDFIFIKGSRSLQLESILDIFTH